MTFSKLVGATLASVIVNADYDDVTFELTDGRTFRLYPDRRCCPQQDCCEHVAIVDLDGAIDAHGRLTDLVGEVTWASEESRIATNTECIESGTWTFYRIGTIHGTVVMRWLGQSNGYYSEGVDFVETTEEHGTEYI